jgi:hypothetical protein
VTIIGRRTAMLGWEGLTEAVPPADGGAALGGPCAGGVDASGRGGGDELQMNPRARCTDGRSARP